MNLSWNQFWSFKINSYIWLEQIINEKKNGKEASMFLFTSFLCNVGDSDFQLSWVMVMMNWVY